LAAFYLGLTQFFPAFDIYHRYASFYVDLHSAVNKQKFIEIYARAISVGLTGKTSMIVKKLKEYLPQIIPKVVMMELIQQANGSYEIVDLFFKRWLRQTWA
jgi:hypothetical protein